MKDQAVNAEFEAVPGVEAALSPEFAQLVEALRAFQRSRALMR